MNVYKYHPRRFGAFHSVYPVISRRSGGLSLGVNLSPTGLCNFACVYCQVIAETDAAADNTVAAAVRDESPPFLDQLENELRQLTASYNDGSLFSGTYLESTPPEKRELRDIAFSGDGEPTLFPQFDEAVERIIAVRNELCKPDVKIVLITNASTLHVEPVRNTLAVLRRGNGEIWAKLDAGTAEYFQRVSQSKVPFDKILTNLQTFTQTQPVIIQTCFFNLHGQPPDENEIGAYAEQLNKLHCIEYIQLYTVARNVPEPWVQPLTQPQLDGIAEAVECLTDKEVRRFY
ncbi:MAG: radical SAM protein [Planctomycetaceae bacterium]|jgi:wyosine [tRNA(Phe)-imidazoG37] synthetase (radical SAM superfamily)|nr:radical SAM protein [Planctomycetaceae bacterium]